MWKKVTEIIIDRELIISVAVLVCGLVALKWGYITGDQYLSIIGYVLSYWLGRTVGRREKISPDEWNRGRRKMLNRLGIVLLASGATLIVEHYIVWGVTWDVRVLCHGTAGIIMVIAGFILASRLGERVAKWLKL